MICNKAYSQARFRSPKYLRGVVPSAFRNIAMNALGVL